MSEGGKISLRCIQTCGERSDVTPFASYTLEGGHRWVWATLVSESDTLPLLACREESNCRCDPPFCDSKHVLWLIFSLQASS